MKKLNICLLTFLAFFLLSGNLVAQEKIKTKKKQVVIITETIDKDGKVTKTKIIKEGDDIEDFEWREKGLTGEVVIVKEGKGNKRAKVIVTSESEAIDMDEFAGEMEKSIHVNVDINEKDGHKKMIIKIKGADGDIETINWQGDGEFPEELKKELLEKGVQLEMIHEKHDGKKTISVEVEEKDGVKEKTIIIKEKKKKSKNKSPQEH